MGKGYSVKAKGKSEAEILIYEDVGESWFGGVTAKQFALDLKGLGAIDTLHVRISSLGGDVMDGLAIYQRLVEHPARVVAHIDGWAASIASVIAMAGDEILIADAGAVMIHEAWGVAGGDAADHRALADRLDANSNAIADVYVSRTGNTKEQVLAWMADETWFYGDEAVTAKFANSVTSDMKVAAHFDPSKHIFKKAPPALAVKDGAFALHLRNQKESLRPGLGTPNLDAARQRIAAMKLKMDRRSAA